MLLNVIENYIFPSKAYSITKKILRECGSTKYLLRCYALYGECLRDKLL